MVHEYYRVKKGKDLNLWVEALNWKCVPIDGNVVCKDPSAYKDFSKEYPDTSDSKPFIANKEWLRFRHRLGQNNLKIIGFFLCPLDLIFIKVKIDRRNHWKTD